VRSYIIGTWNAVDILDIGISMAMPIMGIIAWLAYGYVEIIRISMDINYIGTG
jgi:hypothetical protein